MRGLFGNGGAGEGHKSNEEAHSEAGAAEQGHSQSCAQEEATGRSATRSKMAIAAGPNTPTCLSMDRTTAAHLNHATTSQQGTLWR